jgi:diguanylate cyclase (GGDEF)-like protein
MRWPHTTAKGLLNDLMLLDIGLPDIDGYEVCRRLKANPATAGIPVIFVTARGEAQDIALGYELGASDYVVKPYNLPFVMVHVDSALRGAKSDLTKAFHSVVYEDPANTDQLTGLRNRRFLTDRLQEEADKALRYNYPLSCLMVEIDEVTALDEPMESLCLDDLLVEVAMAMRASSRNYDILARYDGATFTAVLPHITREEALAYARKIEEEIRSATMNDPLCPMVAKLNYGLATSHGANRCHDAEALLSAAMRDLWHAKSGAAIQGAAAAGNA